MSDDEKDALSDVVRRFIDAEESLTRLGEQREALALASQRLVEAGDAMSTQTHTSLEKLEQLRADLRSRLEAEYQLAERRDALDTGVTAVMTEVRAALEQLREIDPARFVRELGELRRDGADNAAEVREVRRLTDELKREQVAIGERLTDELKREQVTIGERFDGIHASQVETLKLIEDTANLHLAAGARHGRMLTVVMTLTALALALGVVGLFV